MWSVVPRAAACFIEPELSEGAEWCSDDDVYEIGPFKFSFTAVSRAEGGSSRKAVRKIEGPWVRTGGSPVWLGPRQLGLWFSKRLAGSRTGGLVLTIQIQSLEVLPDERILLISYEHPVSLSARCPGQSLSNAEEHTQEIRNDVPLLTEVARVLLKGPHRPEFVLLPGFERPSRLLDTIEKDESGEVHAVLDFGLAILQDALHTREEALAKAGSPTFGSSHELETYGGEHILMALLRVVVADPLLIVRVVVRVYEDGPLTLSVQYLNQTPQFQ